MIRIRKCAELCWNQGIVFNCRLELIALLECRVNDNLDPLHQIFQNQSHMTRREDVKLLKNAAGLLEKQTHLLRIKVKSD